jgi:hypothetical protein
MTLQNQGEPLYVDTNAGQVSYIAPGSTGNAIRIIGHTYNISDPWIVRFNPDNFWVEI